MILLIGCNVKVLSLIILSLVSLIRMFILRGLIVCIVMRCWMFMCLRVLSRCNILLRIGCVFIMSSVFMMFWVECF